MSDTSFIDVAVEAFDRRIDECFAKASELLGEEGRKFFIDVPTFPGTRRIYGLQGVEHHVIFIAALGFPIGDPSFEVDVSEPELRDGVLGDEEVEVE